MSKPDRPPPNAPAGPGKTWVWSEITLKWEKRNIPTIVPEPMPFWRGDEPLYGRSPMLSEICDDVREYFYGDWNPNSWDPMTATKIREQIRPRPDGCYDMAERELADFLRNNRDRFGIRYVQFREGCGCDMCEIIRRKIIYNGPLRSDQVVDILLEVDRAIQRGEPNVSKNTPIKCKENPDVTYDLKNAIDGILGDEEIPAIPNYPAQAPDVSVIRDATRQVVTPEEVPAEEAPAQAQEEPAQKRSRGRPRKDGSPAQARIPANQNADGEKIFTPAPEANAAGIELAKLVAPALLPWLQDEVASQIGDIRPIEIKIEGRPEVKITERTHPAFHKILRLANARTQGRRTNVLMVGPAGCGKTTIGHQVARALSLPFTSFSCSAGASEAQLLGRLLPTGEGGKFEYIESPFLKTYREGGVILIDEIDAADANLLVVLNSALANGGIYVEARAASDLNVYVPRHPDCVIIAAANTFGTGADAQYVGRAALDAATLDRFYRVQIDYDRDLEDSFGTAEIVSWVRDLRHKAQEARLRRVVSSRAIQRITAAVEAGLSLAEAKADELCSWTKDERTKVGA